MVFFDALLSFSRSVVVGVSFLYKLIDIRRIVTFTNVLFTLENMCFNEMSPGNDENEIDFIFMC